MITFRISFLLAFSLVSKIKDTNSKNKKGKKGAKTKEKKSKSSKSSKSTKLNRKEKQENVPKPDYFLETGNPIGYAHVEYEFMPGRTKQQIDVICWKEVAQVFFGEETVTFRAKIADEKVWLPIYVEHYVNSLDDDELMKLYHHELNFIIHTNKSKLNPRAKSVNTKCFYLKQQDVNVDDFVPVFTEDPNQELIIENDNVAIVDYIQDIIQECINKPGLKNKTEIVSKLKTKDFVHTYQLNKIINEISNGKSMIFKQFVPLSLPPIAEPDEIYEEDVFKASKSGKKAKDKKNKNTKKEKNSSKKKSQSSKGKKGKQGRKKPGGPLQIKVSGEIFFTDPNLSIYDLQASNEVVSNGYVLISVEKLMTRWQKYEFNPMVVKIGNIYNVPVDILKERGFKSLFVRYHIPYLTQCSTMEKNIEENTILNEAHAHFTNNVPAITFSEFMQSKRFFIEVCGTRDENIPKIQENIFGKEKNDKNISKKFSSLQTFYKLNKLEDYSTSVVLAVAYYDLTSLLLPTWTFVSNESCHNPEILYQLKKPLRRIDFVTANDINLYALYKQKSSSPLTEHILLKYGMSLKLEVCLAAPMYKLTTKLLCCGKFHKRIFMIIQKYDLAAYLLNEIIANNKNINKHVIPNHLNVLNTEDLNLNNYLTGFLIDNGKSYAFFLEGSIRGCIMAIWEKFMYANPHDVKIFFNTNVVFENKLYDKFLNIGGILMITLSRPLRDILSLERIYLEGSVPLPCFQALKKLDLLFRCFTLKDMLQANFFPTADELLSLDLEFGVPLRWNNHLTVTGSQVLSLK